MNCFPTFGILAVLLFAYCTPTQGPRYRIHEALLWDGERCTSDLDSGRSVDLIHLPDNTFEIRETIITVVERAEPNIRSNTKAKLVIRRFHTMLNEVVVVDTNRGLIRLELDSELQVQQLFDVTGRYYLANEYYWYKVSAVIEYNKNCILQNVTITGCADAHSQNPQVQFVIHSGEAAVGKLEPHLIWTEYAFNYRVYDNKSIILTLPKLGDRTFRYYLVKFDQPFDLFAWKATPGLLHSTDIPEAPSEVFRYFKGILSWTPDHNE